MSLFFFLVVFVVVFSSHFSFKNELFLEREEKNSDVFLLCVNSHWYTSVHMVQVQTSSGYHKWCISQLDQLLDVTDG